MTDKEAMAMALDALETLMIERGSIYEKAIAALNARLTQPEQEPVAWWNNTGTHIDLNVSGRGTPLYTHPPQRVEQKMVMWPCLIDTADFSKGTVTVVMQCDDYKVSAGTHWLSTNPPQRTEPEPDELNIAYMSGLYDGKKKRPWVGLTDEEVTEVYMAVEEEVSEHWNKGGTTMMFPIALYKAIEAKLKEKNT